MRNIQTRLRNNAQLDCDRITIAMRKNAHSCAMVTQQFAIVAQRLRNNAQSMRNGFATIA
jgi:hypothetical protein